MDSKAANAVAMRPRVLISDDQPDVLSALSLLLKLNRYAAETVDSPRAALEASRATRFDLIIVDLNYSRDTTSGQEGLDLLINMRRSGITAPIVVMTAWGNVELAVEAMRLGANDFIQKPWDNARLLATIGKQLRDGEAEEQRSRQLRSELDIARHVQQRLLPSHQNPLPHLEFAAACRPAQEVGGDYFDFFDLGDSRLAGLLADVSGKGIAAAMLMANLQACFRSQFENPARDAAHILETVNRLFHAATPPAHYATLFYFDYDDQTGVLQYVNCGHPGPVMLRANGQIERLDATATVLGLFAHCPCECREIRLGPGDILAAFTDGVTDIAMAPALEGALEENADFGEERFIALVQAVRHLKPEAALDHIGQHLALVKRAQDHQFDDQTIMILKAR